MEGRLIVFDVETGGLDPNRHPVIQFAGIAVDDVWAELEALEVKVRFDESAADAEALAVNHYDRETWEREAVAQPIARGMIADFMRRHATLRKLSRSHKPYTVARLAAHNARFDAEFLAAWFKRTNEFLPGACYEALCTLDLARWVSFVRRSAPLDHKLGTLCALLGIEHGDAHDALADVRATVEVARRLTAMVGR